MVIVSYTNTHTLAEDGKSARRTVYLEQDSVSTETKCGKKQGNNYSFGASIHTFTLCPNIEVMCIVKFQYATSAMLALSYDHFLVSFLFLDVPITVIVPSLLLTSFLNVLFNL